jgi:small-conductance mechanosensitive channel
LRSAAARDLPELRRATATVWGDRSIAAHPNIRASTSASAGTFPDRNPFRVRIAPSARHSIARRFMNGLIYLVGLVVVIMFILSLFGLR